MIIIIALKSGNLAMRVGVCVFLSIPYFLLSAAVSAELQPPFPACHQEKRTSCVVDGDTFWSDGIKIRIADIDAPEAGGRARCKAEQKLAVAAAKRLSELLAIDAFTLVNTARDKDIYGRRLQLVMRDGKSIGTQLIHEGLARPWMGKRQSWCQT